MTTAYDAAVRDVSALLAARIVATNLAVTAAHLRRLAEDELDEPDRRRELRDIIVDVEQVRRRLDRVL